MWRRLKHEKRKIRYWDCAVAFDEFGIHISEYGKLVGGFTYPDYDNYEEFADEVFERIEKMILDISFHQGLWERK